MLASTAISGDRLLYRDPTYGWTITYPRSFRARLFTLRGGETSESVQAMATIFAAQLAGVLSASTETPDTKSAAQG